MVNKSDSVKAQKAPLQGLLGPFITAFFYTTWPPVPVVPAAVVSGRYVKPAKLPRFVTLYFFPIIVYDPFEMGADKLIPAWL